MSFLRPCFRHLAGIERKRIAPTPKEHLRLHRLERPNPWEEELRDLIFGTVPENLANFYPDYAAFLERLSRFAGVPSNRIVIGQGIESLIRDLVMLSAARGDAVAFTHPTCAMFPLYAEIFGAAAFPIPVYPDEPPTAADIAEVLPGHTKFLILPNPGQPVDVCFSVEELRIIAARCDALGAMLAIDEAYFGFGAPTAVSLVDEFDNVIVLRTFSKAFGGASLRVGYAIGSETAIRPLDACRQSGEVAGPSIHAATVLMDRFETHVAPGILAICEGRDWLRKELTSAGWKVRGHNANHVLIDMGSAALASDVAAKLEGRGVRVRTNAPPVDRHLLVTCGSRKLMERFHDAFRSVTFEPARL